MSSSYAVLAKSARNRYCSTITGNVLIAVSQDVMCLRSILPCVTFVLAKRLKMNVLNSSNVLYSLPTSLIHSIMVEWIEFSAIFKLDVAVCQRRLRDFHLAFLCSDYFYIDQLMVINRSVGGPDRYHTSADTQRLRWLLARNVKVREFDFACDCQNNDVLNYLKKYGEYVLKLLLSSTSQRFTELEGMSILAMARCCPMLRTFSARSLHLGNNDDHLKDFLQLCPNIVNLDLQSHFNLTDEALMEALSCQKELHSINLSFCWMLTNRTLAFISARFAHSLQVLHLGENQMTQNASFEMQQVTYVPLCVFVLRGRRGSYSVRPT